MGWINLYKTTTLKISILAQGVEKYLFHFTKPRKKICLPFSLPHLNDFSIFNCTFACLCDRYDTPHHCNKLSHKFEILTQTCNTAMSSSHKSTFFILNNWRCIEEVLRHILNSLSKIIVVQMHHIWSQIWAYNEWHSFNDAYFVLCCARLSYNPMLMRTW